MCNNRNRSFFKLNKIEFRNDVTGEPVSAIAEDAPQGREPREQSSATPGAPMESAEASGLAAATSAPSLPVAPKNHEDTRRHDQAPSRPLGSHPPPQKPVVQDRDAPNTPAPGRPHDRVVPLASPVNGHMQVNGVSGNGGYPSNLTVKLDAIDRLQTQVNLNRATLETCSRDINRINETVGRLQDSVAQAFETMRAELFASRQHMSAATAAAPAGNQLDDQALEVFTSTLTNVASKANEVDTLKVQLELIKRKIKRLEEGGHSSSPVQERGAPYPAHTRDHSRSLHHTPTIQQQSMMTPTALSRQTPPSRPEARIQSHSGHDHHSYQSRSQYTPEVAHQQHQSDADPAANGWVSVNPSAKRSHPNGIDGRSDVDATPIGSPKRPKLAPLEPRQTYEAAPPPAPMRFERADTDDSAVQSHTQVPTQSQSQPQSQYRRTESNESYPDSTNPSNFIPYTADQPPDESWRPESQRAVSGPALPTRSPGRGRGRGRGGRPRKSLPVEVHTIGTPEWEKETWTGSQVGPDGYYHPGRGGLVRRGSGGAQGRPPMSPGSTIGDPYGHTKKTRTKPIRNSDGILIRKDGRPDMRSQSSAANLRKVHARKEEEKRMDGGSTSGLAMGHLASTDGHSPDSHFSQETESTSTQEKRNHILRQMFPNGVNDEQGRLYAVEQYFPRNAASPSEHKLSTSASAESERGSRGSSDGDGDERMEDRHAIEEERVRRQPIKERVEERQVIPDSAPTTQSHTLEPSSQIAPMAIKTPQTDSPSTMSAPTTATLTGTAQEAA
jgi:hypothetical protein